LIELQAKGEIMVQQIQRGLRLFTLGRLSARLVRSPGHIERIIAALGIEPTLELNGLAYYSPEQETAIDEKIRAEEIERIQSKPRQV
jgi:hypothetical protein